MFKIHDKTSKELIALTVDGKITKSDYDKVTPLIDKTVKEYGKVKLYIEIDRIEGIEPKAFKEDVKTYLKHFKDIDKIAVVGKNKWEKLWSGLANPFTSGEIKYFDHDKIVEAQKWIMN